MRTARATRTAPSATSNSRSGGFERLAQRVRQPRGALRLVVEADEPAVAVGDEPVVHCHRKAHLERRAADLADRALDRDLLVEVDGRAVVDMALREDQATPAGFRMRRVVLREQVAHEGDPRRLEVAQEDDVVEVAHRVEVAEADAFAMDEGARHDGRPYLAGPIASRTVGPTSTSTGTSPTVCSTYRGSAEANSAASRGVSQHQPSSRTLSSPRCHKS